MSTNDEPKVIAAFVADMEANGYPVARYSDGSFTANTRHRFEGWTMGRRAALSSTPSNLTEGEPLDVQRYTNNGDGTMVENPEGVWCYYEDATKAAAPADAPKCKVCHGTRCVPGALYDPPNECEACIDNEPTGEAALFYAARDFYNATVAESDVRITSNSAAKRDKAAAAAIALRSAIEAMLSKKDGA